MTNDNKLFKRGSGTNIYAVVICVLLVAYVLSMVFLLLWALITSFKDPLWDFRLNKLGLPKEWVWHYTYVFNNFNYPLVVNGVTETVYMGEMYVNSILYSFGCALTNTLVPFITAYLCARFRYKFSGIIHMIVIVTMILPIVGSLPSEIQMAKTFGLFDQIWGLWVMKANFLGMYFLVFYGTFKMIPKGFTEAAQVDGAGNFTIMTRIISPMAINTFFTVMLINFIGFWNDYQTPMIYMPSYPTLAFGMYYVTLGSQKTTEFSSVPMQMTTAMMTLIPILLVFIIFQKRLLGNLTIGGLKE